jgi:hypothetical protein
MEPPNEDKVIPQFEQPAVANDDLLGVRHCLLVCGFDTPPQQDTIIEEGFTEICSFAELRDNDIHEMVKAINAPTTGRSATCSEKCQACGQTTGGTRLLGKG